MESALPLKSVVLFIACGAMVFIIVFLFAKRQITRFALKSNRGPHASIGADSPKPLRQEIERRLRRVADIKQDPTLTLASLQTAQPLTDFHHIYRMQTVDAVGLLDEQMEVSSGGQRRPAGLSLRAFLTEQRLTPGCPLYDVHPDPVDKFCDAYEHARHNPAPFSKAHYQTALSLLSTLIDFVKDKGSSLAEEKHSILHDATSLGPDMTPLSSHKHGDAVTSRVSPSGGVCLQPTQVGNALATPISPSKGRSGADSGSRSSSQEMSPLCVETGVGERVAEVAETSLAQSQDSEESSTLLDKTMESAIAAGRMQRHRAGANSTSSNSSTDSEADYHVTYRPRRGRAGGKAQAPPAGTETEAGTGVGVGVGTGVGVRVSGQEYGASSEGSEWNTHSESVEHLTLDTSETEKHGQNVDSYV